MTEHRLPVRVYYEDTDLAGVVFYANYLRYYERGRSDALRELGVDQTSLKAAGVVFVVRRIEVDYLAPARFEDLLEVVTRVETLKGASAEMIQEIRRGDQVLNRARVFVACMTLEGRPVRLPREARSAMERLLG